MRANQQNTEFHIALKLLGYLRTHWWLLALEVAAIYAFQFYNYYTTPKTYMAEGRLLIDQSQRRLYNNLGVSKFETQNKRNMASLLTSNNVFNSFRRVLQEYYDSRGRPPYLRPYFGSGKPAPVSLFRSQVNLSWDRLSDVYTVTCYSHDPEAATALCRVYMDTITEYYPQIGQREAMMRREFLSRQIDSQLRAISESERRILDLQKENPEFFEFQLRNIPKEKAALAQQIQKIKAKIDENRELVRLMLNIPRAKRGEHLALEKSIHALTRQIAELQYQLQLTRQSQDPNRDDRLAQLNREISDLSAQLGDLNERQIEIYRKNPLSADVARKELQKYEFEYRVLMVQLKSAKEELNLIEEQESRFQKENLAHSRIVDEVRHRKRMLENLYRREQETEIVLSSGLAEIFRVQEPSRNDQAVAPRLSRHLYAGVSISLFIVAITLYLLMLTQPRLDNETEIARLNLPVLGKLPALQGSRAIDDIPTFALEHSKIMNYRIHRETKDIRCPVLIVTSASSREGKTTVTHCLSIASKSPQKKTLLIDGDILTMRPSNFLGIYEDQTPGLKAVVEGRDYNPSDLVVKTLVDGVSFMPRGGRMDPNNIPHALQSLEKLIGQLRSDYDFIFIDTPPLFAATVSHQWIGLADLVILVGRMYYTRPKDIVEALQTCKSLTRAPVGVALNYVQLSGPDRRASSYYFSRKKTPNRMAA